MNQVTRQGTPVDIAGTFPQAGSQAPDFCLAAGDLSDKTLADFAGKRKVLNIFPSVDTGVCAQSVRTFNQNAAANQTVFTEDRAQGAGLAGVAAIYGGNCSERGELHGAFSASRAKMGRRL